jgi:hypothetical protein
MGKAMDIVSGYRLVMPVVKEIIVKESSSYEAVPVALDP